MLGKGKFTSRSRVRNKDADNCVILTHKVVVPRALNRDHEVAKKSVRQKHLHSLIVRWQITFRIVSAIGILSSPFKATRC